MALSLNLMGVLKALIRASTAGYVFRSSATGWTTYAAASQTDQEAASNATNPVVPSVQQFHPSAAKAWCSFDVAGNLGQSYNVSSVTDNGTGSWTVNIGVDFSSAFWSGVATGGLKNGVAFTATCCTGIAAGTFTIAVVRADTGALVDPDTPNLIGFVGYGHQ